MVKKNNMENFPEIIHILEKQTICEAILIKTSTPETGRTVNWEWEFKKLHEIVNLNKNSLEEIYI